MKIFLIEDSISGGRLTQFIAKDTEELRKKVSNAKTKANEEYYINVSDWKATFYKTLNQSTYDKIQEMEIVRG